MIVHLLLVFKFLLIILPSIEYSFVIHHLHGEETHYYNAVTIVVETSPLLITPSVIKTIR